MQTKLQPIPAANPVILSVRNLSLHYFQKTVFERRIPVTALTNVSLDLQRGKTLALVGPSGCGKSSLARCLVLLERPSFGEIVYAAQNLLELKSKELKEVRRDIHLIFQDSASALNPGMTIEEVLLEPLEIHEPALAKKDRFLRLVSACEQAALSSKWLTRRPSELSGGQRQRVAIARSLICRPKILILDEALSALDLSTQSQIANLLLDLQREHALTYLFITHDMRLARMLAHDVVVMKGGRILDSSPSSLLTPDIHANPASIGSISTAKDTETIRLQEIPSVNE
ncbi:MAG TPA: dipeptide/oligopeptide/nickel ABC transporter ATP-binding protein [Candidatus Acidoferrum sp.]|nr:dipeptide/oligopeptide/nickel ABC transporter ATP-binding protein [Candidatus Acidoferrum sp.]